MSTTTCDAPTRYVSRIASRSASSVTCSTELSKSSVSQKIDAVSARAIGVRRWIGVRPDERDVVERVAELVRERRHRVVAAVEVHHHAADVTVDRRAVRAAALAVADLRVDPALRERARREAGQLR